MTIRAGCYLRISSDPNDKRAGVDRQREDTTALCEIKDWLPVDFYIDNDRSASNGKQRDDWSRLLADITAGKLDAIAAWDQDRSWRMMAELEELRKFFTGLGRHVLLATTGQGDIDLYSPTGVLTAQIKTAVSEHEVAMMSVRVRRSLRQHAEQGRPKWAQAFGYLNMGGDVREPDPLTAPLVAQAYAALLAGTSIREIVRMFNDAGAMGVTGKPWSQPRVSAFLRAPRNAGLRSHNNEIVGKGNWEPLVDESTWRAAQSVLNAPDRCTGWPRKVRRYLLTGLLICGNKGCGGPLRGRRVYPKGEARGPLSYSCARCHRMSIYAHHVEPLILEVVVDKLSRPSAVDLVEAERDGPEAEALRLQANTLTAELDALAMERAEGLLTARQVQIATVAVQNKLAAIRSRQLDGTRARVLDGLPLGLPEVVAALNELSDDRLRAVISLLMTITVMPVGKSGHIFKPERVQITWK